MSYLRVFIGALVATIPMVLVLLFMQGGAHEETIIQNSSIQLEKLAELAKIQIYTDKELLSASLKMIIGDKDFSNKLKEFNQLSAIKKNATAKQTARLAELQNDLPTQLATQAGPGLDLTLVSSNGTVILASENAPYPVNTDIKHTTIYQETRSGYQLNGIEIGYNNQPVTLAASPLATSDGVMVVLISFPLEKRAINLQSKQFNSENMTWAISAGNRILKQGSNTIKLRKAPAISDKAIVYDSPDIIPDTPWLLKKPEFCGLVSISLPVVSTNSDLSMAFVLDTRPSYAPLKNSQQWALIASVLAAILFIICSLFSCWKANQAMEKLCDQLSLYVKGTKTNGDLPTNAFGHDLKRIVVLINKLLGLLYNAQNSAPRATIANPMAPISPMTANAPSFEEVLAGNPLDSLPKSGTQKSISLPNMPTIAPAMPMPNLGTPSSPLLAGAKPFADEGTQPGESSMDMGLINKITDNLAAEQKQAAQEMAMPSDNEMMGALSSLDLLSKSNSGIGSLFVPEANNRDAGEMELVQPHKKMMDETTNSALPMPPLNLPDEPLDVGSIPQVPLAATPSSLPDMADFSAIAPEDSQVDLEALEAQAQALDQESHQNSTMIMPISMIQAMANSSTPAKPLEPIQEPAAMPIFPQSRPQQEATQMGPLPSAALLAMAKLQTSNDEEDPDEALYKTIFEDYKRVRLECGESVADLNFVKFSAKLRSTKEKVLAAQNCRDVRFSVTAKNGKATLKATAVK